MADNNITKKFFLDWEGLKSLWSKINSTFAKKAVVEQLNSDLSTVNAKLETLDGTVNLRIDGVEETIDSFIPKDFKTYTDAVKHAPLLVPGAVVNVLADGPLLDESDNPVQDENGATPVYKAGLYIVSDPVNGKIQKISTAAGTGAASNIEELSVVVQQLSDDVVKTAVIVTETGEVLSTVEKTENSLFIKVDDEFVIDSQSVNMLSHRAIAAMYGDLKEQISQLPKFTVSVVDKLPSPEDGISASTIYLLKNSDPTSNNIYAEYIYVKHGVETPHWEKLGEQSLVIEDFAKKTEVEQMITIAMQNVVKTKDLESAIATSKAEILDEISKTYISKEDVEKFIDETELNTSLSAYYTKTETDDTFVTLQYANDHFLTDAKLEDFMTEPDIINSIHTGLIGNEIRITDDLIDSLTE